jgi:O-methyltransferase
MWLHNERIQRFIGGGRLEQTSVNLIARAEFLFLGAHKDREVVKLLKRARRQRKSLMSANETWIVYAYARAASRREGAIAEVGVYQGVSAKLICECKGEKEFHLFDTFEGLPERTGSDRNVHRTGQYATSVESVAEFLKGHPNVHFHKGLFPDSAVGLEEKPYCFVHLDVDLYESTLAGLKYFYPKLVPGGVILSHDYSMLAGVRKAFTEFMADKPEGLVEMPTTQCAVTKL